MALPMALMALLAAADDNGGQFTTHHVGILPLGVNPLGEAGLTP